MTPRIELRGVRKGFGGPEVLAGVDLAVLPGESLVIIGGSGTGKSVTLKCILGILTPDAGQILIDGTPASRIDRRAFLRDFGMLFQGGALFDSLPVWHNVAFRLIHARKPLARRDAHALAVAKLARVGLGPEVADLYPAELSGGMQKRVGLARAIATDPSTIFFDEPTAGLDPIMAGVINDLIRALVEEMGATAITITHDMTTVRTVADHVAMLHGGVVRWAGHIDDMDAAPDPYLQQFIHGRAEGPIPAIR
ncbi:ABC transporter ATP-binding protein [Amaricoccus sp.]|uniref:ABC transporter ATP-binding protein n=1 Tax=Amaricoccus sp. TaxID=1872485 RepID=UPI001B4F748E|nr:ATP-binding cassette domain-containing protein [Amaricoccus sp.]MBP7001316.1 ATP-binding cassette domain-containing protein [Amaricoccus sp.]